MKISSETPGMLPKSSGFTSTSKRPKRAVRMFLYLRKKALDSRARSGS